MKLRLTLVLFCLLGIGVFSHAQNKKKTSKPTIINSPDEIPVTMISPKKHHKPPPPPPAPLGKVGKPLPAPKVEINHLHFKVPPPPPKQAKEKPVKPDAPPAADFRG